jgi:hypothetical protein
MFIFARFFDGFRQLHNKGIHLFLQAGPTQSKYGLNGGGITPGSTQPMCTSAFHPVIHQIRFPGFVFGDPGAQFPDQRLELRLIADAG